MNFFIVLGVASALAMDAFAVSLGLSLARSGLTAGRASASALHFGLFQFLMPIAGWAAGELVRSASQAYDHWIAAGLLVFVGGKMIVESFHKERRIRSGKRATRRAASRSSSSPWPRAWTPWRSG